MTEAQTTSIDLRGKTKEEILEFMKSHGVEYSYNEHANVADLYLGENSEYTDVICLWCKWQTQEGKDITLTLWNRKSVPMRYGADLLGFTLPNGEIHWGQGKVINRMR